MFRRDKSILLRPTFEAACFLLQRVLNILLKICVQDKLRAVSFGGGAIKLLNINLGGSAIDTLMPQLFRAIIDSLIQQHSKLVGLA